MQLSRVELVVLGLLAEGPLHGYELLERYRARSMGYWAEVGRASVYQTLKRLESAGLASGRAQEGGVGPDRRVYRITKPGRDRVRAGVMERLEGAEPYAIPSNVALGLLHLLAPEEARRALSLREAGLNELLRTAAEERRRQAGVKGAGHALAARLLAQQEELARTELAWLASLRRDLARLRR
jgi:DNA-binding PadR family transcriptional regulator